MIPIASYRAQDRDDDDGRTMNHHHQYHEQQQRLDYRHRHPHQHKQRPQYGAPPTTQQQPQRPYHDQQQPQYQQRIDYHTQQQQHGQPEYLKRREDPPAAVNTAKSIVADGIQLSQRQLDLLAKRQQQPFRTRSNVLNDDPSSQINAEDSRHVAALNEDRAGLPQRKQQHRSADDSHRYRASTGRPVGYQRSSDAYQRTIQIEQPQKPQFGANHSYKPAEVMKDKKKVGAATKTSSTESSTGSGSVDEDQRALLRSMLQRGSQKNKGIGGADPNKALLKKVWHQSSKQKSNLGDQLRERIFKKSPKRVETARETSSSQHKLSRSDKEEKSTRKHSNKRTSRAPYDESYSRFMDTLQEEVFFKHSQLWASFASKVNNQDRDAVLSTLSNAKQTETKLDPETVKVLSELNTYLNKKYCDTVERAPKSQLVNDKTYTKSKGDEKKTVGRDSVDKIDTARLSGGSSSAGIFPSGSTASEQYSTANIRSVCSTDTDEASSVDGIMNLRSTSSVAEVAPTGLHSGGSASLRKTQPHLHVAIPPASEAGATDIESKSNPGMEVTLEKFKSKLSLQKPHHFLPPVASGSETVSSTPSSGSDSLTSAKLCSLSDVDKEEASDGKSVPWANVTLRRVEQQQSDESTASSVVRSTTKLYDRENDIESDNVTDATVSSERSTTTRDESSKETKNLQRTDGGVIIPLKGDSSITESYVVVGTTMIMRIQNEADESQATTGWKLPRADVERDGMILDMLTLKVSLVLAKGKGTSKELCFENAEDCLRFATAFYSMSQSEPSKEKRISVPPEISETISEANSSVRLESLNDEEQTVLEKYRELRQNKNAKDALLETISMGTSSRQDQSSLTEEEEKIADKYRKMLKLKMPLGAVQHRMKLEGVASEIFDIVSDTDDKTPPKVVAAADLPSSPISTFTAASATESSTGKLTDEEEKLADSYRLMLKRGLPADAVRHKLTRDQVELKIVQAIFDTNKQDANSTASSSGAQLSEEENTIAEKYRKMLKLRIPEGGVRHKMAQDLVDPKIIAAVFGDQPSATKEKDEEQVVASKKKKTALTEEEESVASQFRKLLKLQVSRDAVLARMEKEGVSEKIITNVLGHRSVSSKTKEESKITSSGSNASNLINLHWNAMEDVPSGSIWETNKNTTEPERSDISKLVELFQKKKPAQLQKERKKGDSGTGKAKLLDHTRSTNIAISLKAFKDFSHKELAEIIGFLDPMRKIRGERSHFIRDLIPTTTEMKIIEDYTGSDDRLVPAELWFRHLRGIKRLETKVQVLRTMEMFSAEATELQNNFRLLAQVCRQVMDSVKLQDVLSMVLQIGNVMNEGTRTGGAAGFRFDSLLRLTQTKTSDGKITLLDYMVTVFVAKNQRETLNLLSDFPDCQKASRMLISDMSDEVKNLNEALKQCQAELSNLQKDMAPRIAPENPKTTSGSDPRSQLFTSILARGASDAQAAVPRPNPEGFAKRDQFLAAVKENKKVEKPSVNRKSIEAKPDECSEDYENSLAGGTARLAKFIETIEETFSNLENQRNETLQACRDLSKYCGESGGIGAATSLLDILAQFASNIETALKKYDAQQRTVAKKQKAQENDETRPTEQSESSQRTAQCKDGRSLVLLVNDVLKSANPRFKEDFKKGRVVNNPSDKLKSIYERERVEVPGEQISRNLDIVSVIKEREVGSKNEELFEDARSRFGGGGKESPAFVQELKCKSTEHSHSGESSTLEEPEKVMSVKERASMFNSKQSGTPTVPSRLETMYCSPSKTKRPATERSKEVTDLANVPEPDGKQAKTTEVDSVGLKADSSESLANCKDQAKSSETTEPPESAEVLKMHSEIEADDVFLTPAQGKSPLPRAPASSGENSLFDLNGSSERLRTRQALSSSKSPSPPTEAKKALDESEKSESKPMSKPRGSLSQTPPRPVSKSKSRTDSTKSETSKKLSLTDRARKKRVERALSRSPSPKKPERSELASLPISPAPETSLSSSRRASIGSIKAPESNESGMARLARKKRIQKRMSR